MPEAREDRGLVGRVRQRLERLDVLRRSGRPDELGPEARRRRDHECHRDTFDRQGDGSTLASLEHARRSAAATRTAAMTARGSSEAHTTASS